MHKNLYNHWRLVTYQELGSHCFIFSPHRGMVALFWMINISDAEYCRIVNCMHKQKERNQINAVCQKELVLIGIASWHLKDIYLDLVYVTDLEFQSYCKKKFWF